MPELPEVETIVRQLHAKLAGKTVQKINIIDSKVIDPRIPTIAPFTIQTVQRRGKAIIFNLNDPHYVLLAHLRMTGHFYHVISSDDLSYKKYLAGIFYLDDRTFFTYNEIRRFGSIRLLSQTQLKTVLSRLGPEPLQLTAPQFIQQLQRFPQARIKTKLLDQHCIAGIGNIYAQEALYHAGINPSRKINSLSSASLSKLNTELKTVLSLAINNNGTTMQNYSHLAGKGNFQRFLAVYKKTSCPKRHRLLQEHMGGRGTTYCPRCQK